MKRTSAICLFLALATSVWLNVPAFAKATYTVFDAPGSFGFTEATSISGGEIAGYYEDNNFLFHGFVRGIDGTITSFDPPGSIETLAFGIHSGAVTGQYQLDNLTWHGFVRAADGTITTFDPPGSVYTEPRNINRKGVIAGSYIDGNSHTLMGFLRAANGTFRTFAPQGSLGVYVFDINDSNMITGYSEKGNRSSDAFVRAADGTITTYNLEYATLAFGINKQGAISGAYYDQNGVHTDYVRAADATVTRFVPKGNASQTYALKINAKGAATGYYTDKNGNWQPFVRGAGGIIRQFHVPNCVAAIAYGIDNRGAIAGLCIDSGALYHGFLRTP